MHKAPTIPMTPHHEEDIDDEFELQVNKTKHRTVNYNTKTQPNNTI